MADHLAVRIVKVVALAGGVFGATAWGLSAFSGASILSLFSGLQRQNEVAPIEDATGKIRADGYISEGDELDRAAQSVTDRLNDQSAPPSSTQTADTTDANEGSSDRGTSLPATTFEEPIRRIAAGINGTQPLENVR